MRYGVFFPLNSSTDLLQHWPAEISGAVLTHTSTASAPLPMSKNGLIID